MDDFFEAYHTLLDIQDLPMDHEARKDEHVVAVWDLLDSDGSGSLDFAELAAGASLLAGGDHEEKLDLMFQLFDLDADGFIQQREARVYFAAVYRVVFAADP